MSHRSAETAIASPEPVGNDPSTPRAAEEPSDPGELQRPSGPAAAVVLAAGIASFALGLLSVLTASTGAVSDALTLSERVGDVSGVSTASALVFFGSWAVLAIVWRRAEPPLARVAVASAILVVFGLLGTFPPVFNAFGA